jgi:transcriptional antiterminator RfaH
MHYWFVATYKVNESKRLISNLDSQKFQFYLPKITVKKVNQIPKEEDLFPGYIFIKTSSENYSKLKFTRGIKNIIQFGDKVAYLPQSAIGEIKKIEKKSKTDPIKSKFSLGQEVMISNGPLEGNLVRICSLVSKDRVGILLSILGTKTRIDVSLKDISF